MGLIVNEKGRRPTVDTPLTPLAPRIEGGAVRPQKPSAILALRAKQAVVRRKEEEEAAKAEAAKAEAAKGAPKAKSQRKKVY